MAPSVVAELHRLQRRLDAFATATSDVVYCFDGAWQELQPLDGKGVVNSKARPLRDWLQRNVPASEHEKIRAEIARAMQTRSLYSLEHRVYRPDGTVGWILSRAAPVLDEAGEVVEWFGVATDITARKALEDELRAAMARAEQSVAELDALYGNLPLGTCCFDTELRFRRINEHLAAINGLPISAHLGRKVVDVVPDLAQAANDALLRVRVTRKPVWTEFKGRTKATGNEVKTWEECWYPILDIRGEVSAVGVLVREVSERPVDPT